jgi:hypothetical protein
VADQLQQIVQRMVEAGESEDNIATVIQHYKTPAAPEAPKGNLGRYGGFKMLGDAVLGAGKAALDNPVQAGALLGGFAAAPFTGGASIAAAGLGAAGGAGLGSIVNAVRGGENGPTTAGGVLKTMAGQGAAGAAGQGAGMGLGKLATMAGKKIYKTALRPSVTLQKDFGDIAETGLQEGVPVSAGGAGAITQKLSDIGTKIRGVLAAKDAERPAVRGLLPAGRGASLGQAPIHPTMPGIRDPRSAGVLIREGAADPVPWDGRVAAGNMIAPREIAERGLGRVRAEVSDRALAGDALAGVDDLQQRFLAQRNQPLSLQDAQRLKQAEQALADSAYRAERMGNPVNGIDPQFHQGIARGAREAIEQRAPEVAGLNQRAQGLIGLNRALEDASYRNVGIGGLRAMLGDFVPGIASRGGIALDRAGQAPLPASFRTALIAALAGQDE